MMDPTRVGASTSFDERIWTGIESEMTSSGLTQSEVIELWPLFLRRVSFARFVALYEIFKITEKLPGFIVECGVFRGQSIALFRQLIEVYSPGDSLKKIIGFDTFEGFVKLNPEDGLRDSDRAKVVGGFDGGDFLPNLERLMAIHQEDSYLPRVNRVQLIKGDAVLTIPRYVEENPGLRISLLNLDLDLYEPTKVALEHLYPLVVRGGVIIFDEYGMPGFPGESKAAENFFGTAIPRMEKFGFAPTPGGYFVKQ